MDPPYLSPGTLVEQTRKHKNMDFDPLFFLKKKGVQFGYRVNQQQTNVEELDFQRGIWESARYTYKYVYS